MCDVKLVTSRGRAKLAATLVALTLCWPAGAEAAGPQDPTLLSCKFTSGRTIGGIVVFKRLNKLRIWYGDGGGEEWDHVDFTKEPMTTSAHGGTSLVLSRDYKHLTLNMDDEHAAGECEIHSTAGVPKNWIAPVLRQN